MSGNSFAVLISYLVEPNTLKLFKNILEQACSSSSVHSKSPENSYLQGIVTASNFLAKYKAEAYYTLGENFSKTS